MGDRTRDYPGLGTWDSKSRSRGGVADRGRFYTRTRSNVLFVTNLRLLAVRDPAVRALSHGSTQRAGMLGGGGDLAMGSIHKLELNRPSLIEAVEAVEAVEFALWFPDVHQFKLR